MDNWARYFCAALCLVAASCGPETPKLPPQGKPQTHITFITDWKAQAEHGGF